MKITIIGHVCIDHNVAEKATYTAAGSPAMFMEKIFRQLPDTQTTIISSYGADFVSYTKGIDIYPKSPIGDKTLVYENVTKGGVRVQKAHNRDGSIALRDGTVEALLAVSDVIVIAPILPNYDPAYIEWIRIHSKKDAQILLIPQGYLRNFTSDDVVTPRKFSELSHIAKSIDLMTVSIEESPEIMEIVNEAKKDLRKAIVMTTGETGAVAYTQDQEIPLPTKPLPENEVVDSVGSGDIFSAGLIYWYYKTRDIQAAGAFANALARQCLFYTPDAINIHYEALIKSMEEV
jgi:sugar/nucleoside kinase (ribokinase family)